MAVGTVPVAVPRASKFEVRRLWTRELDEYPSERKRIGLLAVVVLSTIVLYFEAYAGGGVSPLILAHYKMSFTYYLYAQVIFGAVGAFSAVIGGLGDRIGRANITVVGIGVVALLQLAVVPAMPNKFGFVLASGIIGFAEGAVLVCTPALVRDLTPQHKRASAMGMWTLGPVVGSLLVSFVANHTLSTWPSWQGQYYISGVAGAVMFLVAAATLRELSPALRDQLMVSMKDRTLIELRAKGVDPEQLVANSANPWRQMLRWDIIGMAFGVGVFLLVYYAAVGFFPIFLTTTFKQGANFLTTSQANGIDTWFWAFDAVVLIIVGVLSDRAGVRKPFMVIGGVGAVAANLVLLSVTSHAHTSYYTLVLICSVLAAFLAIGYAPWMAAFTETVEARNPALVAHGLGVYGWVLRVVVAVSALLTPIVVTTVTPIINDAPVAAQAGALATQNAAALKIVGAHPALFAQLAKYPNPTAAPPALLATAVKEVGVPGLTTVAKAAPALHQLQTMTPTLNKLQKAIAANPSRWQRWFWVCIAGELLFIPLSMIGRGRWSPRKARQDAEEHARLVEAELAMVTQPVA